MKTVHLMPDQDLFRFCYDKGTQTLRPQLVFVDANGSIVFEINEVGLKGDALDGRRKLAVVWGESVVFGAGRGWPCMLDSLAPGYQFLNGGIEGDPFANILRRAHELNQQRAVALNLLLPGWHPFPDNRNVRYVLTAFLHKNRNTVLFTMPTALNRRIADHDLSPYLTDHGSAKPFMFCGNLVYSKTHQNIAFKYIVARNAIIREVSSELGIRCVDLFAEFDSEGLDDFRQDFHDILHLRPSTYPKIARAVYQRIKDLLRPASSLPVDIGTGATSRVAYDQTAEAVDLGSLPR